MLAPVRMLVCDDACVWGRPVEGLAEDGEGSLVNCMVTVWVRMAWRWRIAGMLDGSAKQATEDDDGERCEDSAGLYTYGRDGK